MPFIAHLFHIYLFCSFYMFTIYENKTPTQNSWNQMLPDSDGTSKVNIDDASFGGFSK